MAAARNIWGQSKNYILTLLVFSFAVCAGGVHAQSQDQMPGFEGFNDEFMAWRSQQWPFLSASDIPWICVWTQARLIEAEYGRDDELFKADYLQKHAELAKVVQDAPGDLLSQVAAARICLSWGSIETCKGEGVFSRIVALDSNNLEAHLFELAAHPMIRGDTSEERAANTDSAKIRSLIIDASHASHWERYSETASLDWYYAALNFVTKHPPPTPQLARNPDFALAFWLNNSAQLGSSPGINLLMGMCKHWQTGNESGLKAACARIAGLLLEHRSTIGYELRQVQLLANDPFDPEGVRLMRLKELLPDVQECIEPRWLSRPSMWHTMKASVFEDFLTDQVQYGRWEASLKAAIRDYEANPASYAQDPSTCEDLLHLDSGSLAELLGERDFVPIYTENKRKYLESQAAEEQPVETLSSSDLVELVNRLDDVGSVYDPIVNQIARQGMRALPLLIDKLCWERSIVKLSAAWSIRAIDDKSALMPLLEAWAESQANGQRCDEPIAMQMTMNAAEEDFRKPVADRIDPDGLFFLDLKFCDVDSLATTIEADPGDQPLTPYIVTNLVVENTAVPCGGSTVELRTLEWEQSKPKYKTHDVPAGRLLLSILDLGSPTDSTPMPVFIDEYGSPPLALAEVVKFEGWSGYTELWVKVANGWMLIARLTMSRV